MIIAEKLLVARMMVNMIIMKAYRNHFDHFSAIINGKRISAYPARYALFPRVEKIIDVVPEEA